MSKKKSKVKNCYWCNDPLQHLSCKRFIGKELEHGDYAYFCDLICEECYVYNKKVENPNYVGVPVGHYHYERKSDRNCKTCGLEGKVTKLPYKLVEKDKETNKARRVYFCSEECLRGFLK